MKRWMINALLGVFALVFVVSAVLLGMNIYDTQSAKKGFDELSQLRAQILATLPTGEETQDQPVQPGTDDSGEPKILPELQAMYEQNPDLAGWISIPAVGVDYPVMHAPDRKDYYLYRNFKQEKNNHGSLYIWEEADLQTPTDNVTVFGHHMKNGTMFGNLKKYQYKSFWEENQTFTMTSLYERRTYRIFSVLVTSASLGEGFGYHDFTGGTQEEFEIMVRAFKAYSLFDTGITPEYGDQLVCLSTCDYSIPNGRLVVVAVREK